MLLLKDKMGLRMKDFNIFWRLLKNPIFRGRMGFTKTQYIGGLPKKDGAWKVCRFNGGWQERGGGAFEGG